MDLISLYLWSKVKKWMRNSCQATSYMVYLLKSDFPVLRLTTQKEGVLIFRIVLQYFFFCYFIYRDRKKRIWNCIILRQHANLCPCFLLVSLTPGALFCSGREALTCCCPPLNAGTRDKCQFGIYLQNRKLPIAGKGLALSVSAVVIEFQTLKPKRKTKTKNMLYLLVKNQSQQSM